MNNKQQSLSFENTEEQFWILLKENPKSVNIYPEIYKNEAFITEGIKNIGGWFLQYASDELRKNKELIKLSLEYKGRINYLPNDVNTDIELVSIYLHKTQNINLCHYKFTEDRDIIIQCLEETIEKNQHSQYRTHEKNENIRKIIKAMSPSLFYDEKIQQLFLPHYVDGLKYAPKELKNNDEEMLKIIKIHPLAMQFSSRNFKDNREYAFIALEKAKEMNIKLSDITSYCSKRIRKVIGKTNPLEQMNKWLLKDNLESHLAKNKLVKNIPKI